MSVETDIADLQTRVGTLELQQTGNFRESAATEMNARLGARYSEIVSDLLTITTSLDRIQTQVVDLLARISALEA